MNTTATESDVVEYDAIIVGAGFAGIAMLQHLREAGLSVRVIEAAHGPGGTWYWNRYPGARCDTESVEYSFSFSEALQQEWSWSERYASQPELIRYINHVADRFDLWRDMQFDTRVRSATFEQQCNRWLVELDNGQKLSAQFCIMATGCLSTQQVPDYRGLDGFRGNWYHTGNWPHSPVDFTGQRVGVVGTGSSGIQLIPNIAREAKQLFVFQRTPNFSVPARNMPMDEERERWVKEHYHELRRQARESRRGFVVEVNDQSSLDVSAEERNRQYESRWRHGGLGFTSAFNDLLVNPDSNHTAAEFVRSKIRESVKDPDVAEILCPTGYPIGTKRLCVDTDYYDTYNRGNVTLVDIKSDSIQEIVPGGIRTQSSTYDLDSIVFATGFDAMTGALFSIDIRGLSGESLKEKWEGGPNTYLGVATAGFPNLFMITGPGSPSVLSNMMVSIEQHVWWITDCITYMNDRGLRSIEATADAECEWTEHVRQVAETTLYPMANSWWIGANIPGKPRVFMPYVGGVGAYREICNDIACNGYKGFALS